MPFRVFAILALFMASAVSARAQVCYAENDGTGFNNAVSMGGGMVGVKFTAPASIPVFAIEVFTGEASGQNSAGIWSHDALGNQPAADLGTGIWSMIATNSWQGAPLPAPVQLTGGLNYWMVWVPGNGAQASVDNPGPNAIVQQYRPSFNNGVSWTGPFSFPDRPWKFRLTCGALPYQTNQACASFVVNGVASSGFLPATVALSVGQSASVPRAL